MRTRNPLLTMDDRNFIYLDRIKLCRYIPERHTYEFMDKRRTRNQPSRIVEVEPQNLAAQIIRLTEHER